MHLPRIVIAGERSGAGKSTVTLGILKALEDRGIHTQPFKTGPDYLDPMHHVQATGRPSRNLDTWMFPGAVRQLFCTAAANADISVIEGVMGLYDGVDGIHEEGSTAHLAKMLDAPVILVIDAGGSARSAGAVALGFATYDPDIRLAGVIFNNVGSATHLSMLAASLRGVRCLGGLPREQDIGLSSRHLGLVPAAEDPDTGRYARMAQLVEANIDLDALITIAEGAADFVGQPPSLAHADGTHRARIGVATDSAFNFYYADNLDMLRAQGATLVPFSPLEGTFPDVDGAYFGGGFPELHAARLAANRQMISAVRLACSDGMPVLAECGGLMYLSRNVRDFDGTKHRMAGVFDATVEMTRSLQALGYVETTCIRDTPLARRGTGVRGHEFHYSRITESTEEDYAYYHRRGHGIAGGYDGFVSHETVASYLHIHFGALPAMAERFVEACAAHARR
ncbi:MAG: cobyrinate a,c-diamide synthase [Candidatus Methanofastidiosa archaeon]|nr:cobyrinate a,c-diamide synthase [Candidatus Methanofastidiosa archaeon]